ncbi:hypothetical protein AAG570_011052 [Ranatra chinensis]|uniref:Uncharacterized protein n=1 Tax=Ranatra chinensis TaxID=642074 RepID=A0ABD0YJI4_9HEMI
MGTGIGALLKKKSWLTGKEHSSQLSTEIQHREKQKNSDRMLRPIIESSPRRKKRAQHVRFLHRPIQFVSNEKRIYRDRNDYDSFFELTPVRKIDSKNYESPAGSERIKKPAAETPQIHYFEIPLTVVEEITSDPVLLYYQPKGCACGGANTAVPTSDTKIAETTRGAERGKSRTDENLGQTPLEPYQFPLPSEYRGSKNDEPGAVPEVAGQPLSQDASKTHEVLLEQGGKDGTFFVKELNINDATYDSVKIYLLPAKPNLQGANDNAAYGILVVEPIVNNSHGVHPPSQGELRRIAFDFITDSIIRGPTATRNSRQV